MNALDIIKSHLLDTMDYFHEFCENHGLTYYIVGGTLLGAVRHKGFIPWDDDIDLIMPRNDYNKLLQLSNKINANFKLADISLDKNYPYPYIKLFNKNLIINDGRNNTKFNNIWVDIFPCDYSFSKPILQKIHFLLIGTLRNAFTLTHKNYKENKYSGILKKGIKSISFLMSYLPQSFFICLFSFVVSLPRYLNSTPKYYANLFGAWGVRECLPKQVFSSKRLFLFENRYYWGPKNYDILLTNIYGNYMKLPDASSRIPAHDITILEEIKKSRTYSSKKLTIH